jgi:hypothetical protein
VCCVQPSQLLSLLCLSLLRDKWHAGVPTYTYKATVYNTRYYRRETRLMRWQGPPTLSGTAPTSVFAVLLCSFLLYCYAVILLCSFVLLCCYCCALLCCSDAVVLLCCYAVVLLYCYAAILLCSYAVIPAMLLHVMLLCCYGHSLPPVGPDRSVGCAPAAPATCLMRPHHLLPRAFLRAI